ncbi:hypothetical protein ACQ4M3_09765 [Leptolyngbya sp. AN03gr2]|uniref:hypothetical protein n=1 Tax=Leptolyngbya sp. AN03gr2 TaxID=3423364 RepID=UPI003D31B873
MSAVFTALEKLTVDQLLYTVIGAGSAAVIILLWFDVPAIALAVYRLLQEVKEEQHTLALNQRVILFLLQEIARSQGFDVSIQKKDFNDDARD